MADVSVNLTIIPATDRSDGGQFKSFREKFQAKGLEVHPHASGLNIHGDIHDVMNTVKQAVSDLHDGGVDRVYTLLQIESRRSGVSSLSKKLGAIGVGGGGGG